MKMDSDQGMAFSLWMKKSTRDTLRMENLKERWLQLI